MAWSEILGQDTAAQYLQGHLASGQVASAYLLAGPDGVGKRRLCLETAKALNCGGTNGRPCDACASCRQISRGVHPDVHVLSPEGASVQIKMDTVRQLLGRIALRPFSARYQVAILDGAERLTEEAANSLLKSLEEPPEHARFLLTTSQLSQCLPTIVSRCQVIRCRPLSPQLVHRILADREGIEAPQADAAARCARGSVAATLALLDGWTGYERAIAQLTTTDLETWLRAPLPDTREGVAQFLDAMLAWLRDLAVTAAGNPQWALHTAQSDALRRLAGRLDLDRCLAAGFEVLALRESLEQFVSPSLVAGLAREHWLSLTAHG